ncbi:MAG: class I SAM-dependent DNA methyltransferase, partial [Verrucomicrobia bacterium]|nr:class I SAM-dependent DNA methyltransferase [Verrucomicrobiota bacterium]
AHRKRAQAEHGIGLTDLYNVLEKVRAGTALNAKEKTLHDQALVSTLRQLHDDLDAAVAAAYGWPWPLTDADILERVVALNAARAAEEAKGIVRWLRPDYQKPLFAGDPQSALGLEDAKGPDVKSDAGRKSKAKAKAAPKKKPVWPKALADRVHAVEAALAAEEKPATAADLAARFARCQPADVLEILTTLVTLGHARPGDAKGTFVR